MKKISTDKAIEVILYAVAEKQKMGIDTEESVRVAKNEILAFWERDMREMEKDIKEIEQVRKTPGNNGAKIVLDLLVW